MRRLRVLLADDYSRMLTLLQLVLEPTYQVVGTVEDGQSLIAAAQALRPDIILTDVDMPIMNGIDAIRERDDQLSAVGLTLPNHGRGQRIVERRADPIRLHRIKRQIGAR